MHDLSSGLAILSAMITPAVLISACGSLILATSQRLNHVIERTRNLAESLEGTHFDALNVTSPNALDGADLSDGDSMPLTASRSEVLLTLLERATRRTRFLQRALFGLYLALSVFVATSVAIGVVAVFAAQQSRYFWFPIGLGISGAGLLFYASILLISESRIALVSVHEEMDFFLRIYYRKE